MNDNKTKIGIETIFKKHVHMNELEENLYCASSGLASRVNTFINL